MLTNIAHSITTAGLNPSTHLSFSQANITGSWDIGSATQTGDISIPAETITKRRFSSFQITRAGSQVTGGKTL